MNFHECLEEGYIKKDESTKIRVENSIKLAEKFLHAAEKNLEINENTMGEIAAYNSTFHSLRALLFSAGYRERSHYCLMVAVEELFPDLLKEHMQAIHRVRMRRHQVQYDGIDVSREEVKMVIELAGELLGKIKEYFSKASE